MMRRFIVITSAATLLTASAASAQQPASRRVEVGADLHWLAGISLGRVDANETAFGGATRTVFSSSTKMSQAPCPAGRANVSLSSMFDAEGRMAFCKTHLTTSLSADPEAADATIAESLTESLFEGGIVAHPARWRRGRTLRFVSAGGGYMRQLHEGHLLSQSGAIGYVGGGLQFPNNDSQVRGWKSRAFRIEVRATILTGSLTPNGGAHILPTVIAGVSIHP